MHYTFLNNDLTAIVVDPSVSNLNSVSAFEKAGLNIIRTVQLVDEALPAMSFAWSASAFPDRDLG